MISIGTPLSPNATKVMLLGSGELGREVLIALQRLGVETIAVDRYDNAPGQQVAHHARTITMSDPDQLKALIEAERPDVVVPEIEAIATGALQELEAAGVVRVIPTALAARLTMDREGIRRLAAETLGLPTSPYRFCDSQAELQAAADAIGYPCVVKPVMSSSGKGQSKLDGPDDVAAAWAYAMAGGRVSHGRVIVEGFIDFDYEITLLTVRARGVDGEVGTQFCAPIGHKQVNGDYVESWQPHPMSAAALDNAQRIARIVTEELGGQGIFGVELFVKADHVWFSEVSPRPHDTGMVTMITQWQNEFELHARAILGLPVDTTCKTPGASAVIYGGVDAEGVVFDGVDEALRVPRTDLRLFGKPESFVKRRMGVALAYDETWTPRGATRSRRRVGSGHAKAQAVIEIGRPTYPPAGARALGGDRLAGQLVSALPFHRREVEGKREREAGEEAGQEEQPWASDSAPQAVDDGKHRHQNDIGDHVILIARTRGGVGELLPQEGRIAGRPGDQIALPVCSHHEVDVEPIAQRDRRDAGGVIHAFQWRKPRSAFGSGVELPVGRDDPGDAGKPEHEVNDDRGHGRSLALARKFCQD